MIWIVNTVSSFQLKHYEHLQEDREIWWTRHFNCSWPTNVGKQGTSNLRCLLQKSFIFLWYHCCVCVLVVCCLCCVSKTCVLQRSVPIWPDSWILGGLRWCQGSLQHFPQMGPLVGGCTVDLEFFLKVLRYFFFSKNYEFEVEPPLTQFGHSSSSGTRK